MELSLHLLNDKPESQSYFESIVKLDLVARLKTLESRALRKGIGALDPSKNRLIAIGMELDESGKKVKKDHYGVFNLAWQAARHPEWAEQIRLEVDGLRGAIRQAHGAPLQFLIWAGMGGSAEDKHMYQALGLLNGRPRCYVLDSTDPAKLKYILEDIQRRSKLDIAAALRRTLVAGMALGMTSYEPVVNLERLASLYDHHRIDSQANFIYLTIPGSLLDQFAAPRGYRRIELQLDRANSTAGRHSSPLTRGSLYPLGLCGVPLGEWIAATDLTPHEIATAWRLSAFLHAQIGAGRDKVTLILPKGWAGAARWTKQEFEESLGKSEAWGIKIVIGEKIRITNYEPPREPAQDRVFLAIHRQGDSAESRAKAASLRRAGYPLATLTLPRSIVLSRYMQFVHYAVFGLAWMRDMNFVTQPGVELYKAIANRLYAEASKNGGIEKTAAWTARLASPRQSKWRARVTLHHNGVTASGRTAPRIYAELLRAALSSGAGYAELTFFGDTRYSPKGRSLLLTLNRGAEALFRAKTKIPVDIYEGPAVNHSYHEMIIGHGRYFSTILMAETVEQPREIEYSPDYHRAQFLSTIQALEDRGRAVTAITLKDLEASTLDALEEFFHQAAASLH